MYISFHFYRLEVFPIYLVLQIFSGIYAPVSWKYIIQYKLKGKKRRNQNPNTKYKYDLILLTNKGWQYIRSLSRWFVIISNSWPNILFKIWLIVLWFTEVFGSLWADLVLGRLVYAAGYQSGGKLLVSLSIPWMLIDLL